jgi:hypothetical protein
MALTGVEPAHATDACVWEARLAEASTPEGYRVSVIFSSFTGQQVRLQVDEQPVIEKTLTTEEWSAAYSGSIQCRLEGRTHFTVTVDGRTTWLYLNVDGPLHIYVSPEGDGLSLAFHEIDLDGYLLD